MGCRVQEFRAEKGFWDFFELASSRVNRLCSLGGASQASQSEARSSEGHPGAGVSAQPWRCRVFVCLFRRPLIPLLSQVQMCVVNGRLCVCVCAGGGGRDMLSDSNLPPLTFLKLLP